MATFRSLHQSGHKTANHGSSMATTFKIIFSPQNCKPWQFYGHFSESTKSGHKTASRFFILQFCIHSVYKLLKVAIELLGFAVLWPLFIDSEKWPLNCQGLQFCGEKMILNVVAIELPWLAVL